MLHHVVRFMCINGFDVTRTYIFEFFLIEILYSLSKSSSLLSVKGLLSSQSSAHQSKLSSGSGVGIEQPCFIFFAANNQFSKEFLSKFSKMTDTKPGMRKPVFIKVDQLQPGTCGHTLTVKVVSSKTVMQKGRPSGPQVRQMHIAECIVGDETGTIIFTARNEQVDMMKPGTTVILRNAKIDMYRGSMRLAVDKWGRVEVTDAADFNVKEDNNLSLVEYELVSVPVE